MHICQSPAELLFVTNKAVPELVLPERAGALADPVEPASGNPFDILHHARDRQRVVHPDQRMPMIRHKYVPAKMKAQLSPRFLPSAEEQCVLILGECATILPKIDRKEENPARDEQALHSGHSRSVLGERFLLQPW